MYNNNSFRVFSGSHNTKLNDLVEEFRLIPGACPKSQMKRKVTKKKDIKVMRDGLISELCGTKIKVAMGDITDENSGAIVCATNPFMDF